MRPRLGVGANCAPALSKAALAAARDASALLASGPSAAPASVVLFASGMLSSNHRAQRAASICFQSAAEAAPLRRPLIDDDHLAIATVAAFRAPAIAFRPSRFHEVVQLRRLAVD